MAGYQYHNNPAFYHTFTTGEVPFLGQWSAVEQMNGLGEGVLLTYQGTVPLHHPSPRLTSNDLHQIKGLGESHFYWSGSYILRTAC